MTRAHRLLRRYWLQPSAATRAAWLATLFASLPILGLIAAMVVPYLLRTFAKP
jgi:hypothetical protein